MNKLALSLERWKVSVAEIAGFWGLGGRWRFQSLATSATTVAVMCLGLICASTLAQQGANPTDLANSQERVAEKYDRLELLAGRLAELSRATQPRRAKLLRELVAKSREEDLPGKFDTVIAALKQDSLATAVQGQGDIETQLQALLDLLLQEDRDRQIEAERKRIAKYLAELNKLIRSQRGIKARTEGGDDQAELTTDQERTAQQTGKLSDEIKATEGSKATKSGEKSDSQSPQSSEGKPNDGKPSNGKPSDGKPQDGKPGEGKPSDGQKSDGEKPSGEQRPSEGSPGEQGPPQQGQPGQPGQPSPGGQQAGENEPEKPADRATERLRQAQQRMRQAIQKLEEAKRTEATDEQEQALRELEQAKAELERILRQLREEELERMLVLLEARFRKMLDAQIAVYEQTKSLDTSQANIQDHELEIASGRLSRKERQIAGDADRALVLLREDGTSVAFPEAIEQAREDMLAVAERLAEVKLGTITQALEEDIIAALEETLAALQQALKDLREQKARQQKPGGEPGEQPLVDQLAELRMIRALQMRINRRTKMYGDMIEGEQAVEDELLEALDHLSEREERVFRATLDLHQGANK